MKKTYNAEKARAAIEARIAECGEVTPLVDWLIEYAKEKQGQQITKRICTAFKKAFPDYTAHWDTSYGMYNLTVWKGNYNRRNRFLIGYESAPVLDPGKVEYCLKAHYLDRERVGKYRESLDKLDQWITDLQRLEDEREKIEEQMKAFEVNYYVTDPDRCLETMGIAV